MRHIHIYLIAILSLLCIENGLAQNTYQGELKFENFRAQKRNDQLLIQAKVNFNEITLNTQHMVLLTPVLRTEDQTQSHSFAPIVITGKTRDKALQRAIGFDHFAFDPAPQSYLVRANGEEQSVNLALSVEFKEWMRDAEFLIQEQVSGCAECDLGEKEHLIEKGMLPPLFNTSYELVYVTPEAEPVKQRSETHTARLNFKVGKYDLLRDFQNNARILDEVDQIVREIKNDENLTVQNLAVTGYASPEGNFNSNMTLSKNRAYAFVEYLVSTHGLPSHVIKTDWKGEDWEGLRKVVAESYLSEKEAILRVIDNNIDINRRKQALKGLSGGQTYNMLLANYYPPLRRNEYTIDYVARPFSIEEAKELIKTKPQHLSLNEMFLVANSYPKDSPEFKEVFDIAVRMYPEDEVAQMNSAAQEIESGAYEKGIARLLKINHPEALNNLGVAYGELNNFDEASNYFRKAIEAGSEVAKRNLEQLEKFLQN